MYKVLFITTTIKDEGPGNLLGSLLLHLDRNLVQPYILTVQGAGKWQAEYKKHNIPVKNLNLKTPLDFASLPFIYRHIKKIKPDLIHTQLLTADLFGRMAARLAGVSYVTTIHNMDDWKRSAKPLSLGAKYVDAWQLKKALAIVAVSEAVKKDTVNTQQVPEQLIRVIRNSIDTQKFQNSMSDQELKDLKNSLNLPKGSLVIGSCARLSYQKNPELWLLAAKHIVRKYPNVHFIWAGDGPLMNKIKELVETNNLSKNVHLLGWRTDLPRIMQIIDIYTLVSRWEGLPLTLIEAMSAKKTCLASNVSGNPEVIKHKQTGWLVGSNSPTEVVEGLEVLIKDKNLRDQLAKNARNFVQDNFNLPRMVQEYEEFYRTIFNNLSKS